MKTQTFLYITILIVGCLFLYNRYEDKLANEDRLEGIYSSLQDYLLQSDPKDLSKSKKPILWIPLQFEYNSRDWLSFGSRSSFELNQPYLYLTVKSIITCCESSFHICIINDDSFKKLLPDWNTNLSIVSTPLLDHLRQIGYLKLIHKYGGIIVPPSFLCFENLYPLFEKETLNQKPFVIENRLPILSDFGIDIRFIGAKKENKIIEELIWYIQNLVSTDYTSENIILGNISKWCAKKGMNRIDGRRVGTKLQDGTPLLVDHLMSEEIFPLHSGLLGIFIPSNEILSRTNYNWYARLSIEQVRESTVMLSKYLNAQNPVFVKEPVVNRNNGWISYWDVPLHAPMWGLKPNDLGNRVRKG